MKRWRLTPTAHVTDRHKFHTTLKLTISQPDTQPEQPRLSILVNPPKTAVEMQALFVIVMESTAARLQADNSGRWLAHQSDITA